MSILSVLHMRQDESYSPKYVLNSMLLPDENILVLGKVSDGIYWKSGAMACITFLFIVIAALYGMPWHLQLLFGGALCIKVLMMTTIAYLRKHYLVLAATDKRVIIRVGIINLEIIQMRYAQIESSEVASTIPGRFFGYSNVFISGTGGRTLAVPFIFNAAEFRNKVIEILAGRDDIELTANEHMSQLKTAAL